MLDEFCKVDFTISIEVCRHSESYNFMLGQIDFWALGQALGVLREIEGTVHVSIILFECSEKLHLIEVL